MRTSVFPFWKASVYMQSCSLCETVLFLPLPHEDLLCGTDVSHMECLVALY